MQAGAYLFPMDPRLRGVTQQEALPMHGGKSVDPYDRIDAEQGVFWPCPSDEHAGTPRPFAERFATPSGRARFHPVRHQPPAEDA